MDQTTGALRPSRNGSWQARLAGYRPQGMTAERWAVVLPFVAGCMERLDMDDGPGRAGWCGCWPDCRRGRSGRGSR